MATKQQRIDAIVARERAAGKPRATAINIAMQEVKAGSGKSTTPVYDKAVKNAQGDTCATCPQNIAGSGKGESR